MRRGNHRFREPVRYQLVRMIAAHEPAIGARQLRIASRLLHAERTR